MLEWDVSLIEWERRKGKKENEALLMLLRCCVSWLQRAITHTVNSRVSHENSRGQKMKRWVPVSSVMAGSDVAMLAPMILCPPRWLQFAWSQSDRRHLSQSLWPSLTSGTGSRLCGTELNADMGRALATRNVQLWPDQNFVSQTDLYSCETSHKHMPSPADWLL